MSIRNKKAKTYKIKNIGSLIESCHNLEKIDHTLNKPHNKNLLKWLLSDPDNKKACNLRIIYPYKLEASSHSLIDEAIAFLGKTVDERIYRRGLRYIDASGNVGHYGMTLVSQLRRGGAMGFFIVQQVSTEPLENFKKGQTMYNVYWIPNLPYNPKCSFERACSMTGLNDGIMACPFQSDRSDYREKYSICMFLCMSDSLTSLGGFFKNHFNDILQDGDTEVARVLSKN